ncbi:MAG: hypothetical protein GXP38_06035, partial [Chloroflexi bacterium]|nr:hypothetical protein [Chloroflexota bacterium]
GLVHRRLRLALRRIVLLLLVAVTLGGWWYVRNLQLYGDPTALKPFLEIVGGRPQALTLHNLSTELQGLRISFLAVFGWFNLLLPEAIYRVWDAFLLVSGVGLVLAAGRRWRRGWRPAKLSPRSLSFLALVLWVIVLFASLLRWISMTPGAQARLLFPAIIAINLFLLLGWRALCPGRERWLLLPPAVLLILALISPFFVIRPAYQAPPTLSSQAIPAAARLPDPVDIDGRVRLLGASVHPTRLYPAETFTLTLYWQALTSVPYDASIFVHLLGRGNETVGGIDTYPGWGTAPTSQWVPGDILVDTYQIPVPATIAAPTLLKVDVGLFDYTSKLSYPSLTASGQIPPLGIATLQVPLPATANVPLPPEITPLTSVFADQIRLEGYHISDTALQPGDNLVLTLVWQGVVPMSEDYVVFVQLLDGRGQRVVGFDSEPRQGWWPTSAWEPGALVVDSVPLAIPTDLAPGRYDLRLGLYLRRTLQRLSVSGANVRDNALSLGMVDISLPQARTD